MTHYVARVQGSSLLGPSPLWPVHIGFSAAGGLQAVRAQGSSLLGWDCSCSLRVAVVLSTARPGGGECQEVGRDPITASVWRGWLSVLLGVTTRSGWADGLSFLAVPVRLELTSTAPKVLLT